MPVNDALRNRIDSSFPRSGGQAYTPTQFGNEFGPLLDAILSQRIDEDPARGPNFADMADSTEYLADRVIAYMIRPDVSQGLRNDYSMQIYMRLLAAFQSPQTLNSSMILRDASHVRDAGRIVTTLFSLSMLFSVQDFSATLPQPNYPGLTELWFQETLQTLGLGFLLPGAQSLFSKAAAGGLAYLGVAVGSDAGYSQLGDPDKPSTSRLAREGHRASQLRVGVQNRLSKHALRLATWNIGPAYSADQKWEQIADIFDGREGPATGVDVLCAQEIRDSIPTTGEINTDSISFPIDQYSSAYSKTPPNPPVYYGWQVHTIQWTPPSWTSRVNIYLLVTGRQNRNIAILLDPGLIVSDIIVVASPGSVTFNPNDQREIRPVLGVRAHWQDEPDNPITIYSVHAETGHGQDPRSHTQAILATLHRRTAGRWAALGDFNTEPPLAFTPTGAKYWPTDVHEPTHIAGADPTADKRLDYLVSDPSTATIPTDIRRIAETGNMRDPQDPTKILPGGWSDHCAVRYVIPGVTTAASQLNDKEDTP
ncbi:cytolethal distending toxin subunit CdtB [Mycobacteroides abscessus subsp. bolletii]|uniref:hypothetical protein n=1 Tax=Mycobacteroides abscessus TaxID=36809 RepID=UPI00092AEDE5|nr:hypothetical protein [Mycobacteroides abscessus]SIJ06540.1 cytolethal distending toxin subunit CdtB [Mycobacteroides abscessus subsp. bolletii]SLD78977.1 cytolethal distending toxin subunit CdtB [Mycobacteroides abscessus subsp. bolletii]SLD86106.1 cytolethal distending toxin subunit CdtB [Mycobacteroides abscessus subsp. bolletii]